MKMKTTILQIVSVLAICLFQPTTVLAEEDYSDTAESYNQRFREAAQGVNDAITSINKKWNRIIDRMEWEDELRGCR